MVGYLQAIWRCRYFWTNLVKMDLRTRYRRSVLGLGWSLLHPLAMTAILCVVFQQILLPDGDALTYAPFLLAGLATWSFILTSATHGCHCFMTGESYIRQYPAPLAIYPLRTALGGLIHFLIALGVVLVAVWILNGFENLSSVVHLLPSLLLLFIFAWSMAVLTGFANVYFQDTQHLIEVGFQILLYMTPIIYPTKLLRNRNMGWLSDYNPLAALLDLIREPVLAGNPLLEGIAPTAHNYAVAGLFVLATFSAAVLTLARGQRRLIFYL